MWNKCFLIMTIELNWSTVVDLQYGCSFNVASDRNYSVMLMSTPLRRRHNWQPVTNTHPPESSSPASLALLALLLQNPQNFFVIFNISSICSHWLHSGLCSLLWLLLYVPVSVELQQLRSKGNWNISPPEDHLTLVHDGKQGEDATIIHLFRMWLSLLSQIKNDRGFFLSKFQETSRAKQVFYQHNSTMFLIYQNQASKTPEQ